MRLRPFDSWEALGALFGALNGLLMFGLLGLLLLLAGCTTPQVVTVHLCLPEVTYDAPSVQGVVAEMDKAEMTGVSMPYTERMIIDYHQMRKDNASCLKGTTK